MNNFYICPKIIPKLVESAFNSKICLQPFRDMNNYFQINTCKQINDVCFRYRCFNIHIINFKKTIEYGLFHKLKGSFLFYNRKISGSNQFISYAVFCLKKITPRISDPPYEARGA